MSETLIPVHLLPPLSLPVPTSSVITTLSPHDALPIFVISKGKTINKQLAYLHNSFGAVLSSFDCWGLMRGMKTLALRSEEHTSELQSRGHFVCRLLLEEQKNGLALPSLVNVYTLAQNR